MTSYNSTLNKGNILHIYYRMGGLKEWVDGWVGYGWVHRWCRYGWIGGLEEWVDFFYIP